MKKCKHCKMDIEIRNPSGFCDHLYYPAMCEVCKPKSKTDTDRRKLELFGEVMMTLAGVVEAIDHGMLLTPSSRHTWKDIFKDLLAKAAALEEKKC